MPDQRPPTIDPIAAERWTRVAPALSPWLHEEVARRMEDRLQWITLQPASWCDWSALRGGLQGHALLSSRFPAARRYVVEPLGPLGEATRRALAQPWWRAMRRGAGLQWGEPPAGGVQMLWSNMALHMEADPQALMSRWHHALGVGGFLMFSCLGPDTVRELRALYESLGWPAPGHAFTDMHDWGDMLVHAGFAEPIMDMERVRLTFDSPQRLLQELRELGRNLHPGRFPALRGRGWRAQLERALQQLAIPEEGGRLGLSFEVVYGHAFKPAPRLPVASQSSVSLDDMRAALRQGRAAGK